MRLREGGVVIADALASNTTLTDVNFYSSEFDSPQLISSE